MDFEAARRLMVDGQLRPNRVTDTRLLAAMRDLPREAFVPPAFAARACADGDVPLPGGRAMMQPMVIGRLLQALTLHPGDRLLVIGATTGYAAAVAAACGAQVLALEEDAALAATARDLLGRFAPRGAAQVVAGRHAEGHPEGAPYDAILIEGEVPEVPERIAAQLAEGGRLAAVIEAAPGRGSRAVLGTRAGGVFSAADAFDCSAAPVPGLQREPGFVF